MSDRELQLTILNYLNNAYPEDAEIHEIPGHDSTHFNRCMFYLQEHDLIKGHESGEMGTERHFLYARITAKGIDFLADDGGLSAILGLVTVKLHEDTIRELVASSVSKMDVPQEKKSKIIEAMKNAPSTVVTEVTKRLVGLALEQAPNAIQHLQGLLTTNM